MSETMTVGDAVAVFLERCGVERAFGVISIHNMPILDALLRREQICFVPARSEGGAVNMADGYARVSGGLGVAFSSTGTAAGNACGALVEAATAGTPLLHVTGQIDTPHLDRGRGYLHEARDQLGMLGAVGKGAFRVAAPETVSATLREAALAAMTPPTGPVSVEIPVDVQAAGAGADLALDPLPIEPRRAQGDEIDELAQRLNGCGRVMLWLGGGARGLEAEVERLAGLGLGIVTSVQGRGVDGRCAGQSLGAFNLQPPVEAFYATCDAMIVVGSRLRSNETLNYSLNLPRPLFQVDVDPAAENRSYRVDHFVCGDACDVLDGLAGRLEQSGFRPDPGFGRDLHEAREAAEKGLRAMLGPYEAMLDAVCAAGDAWWVRDITLSNTMWGNRLPALDGSRKGVHAAGGGIGQGLPMAIGASLAARDLPSPGPDKALLLAGDGGFAVTLGELATAAQENADIVILLMNDGGYGVIRNIQDARYGGRRAYADILAPDFGALCGAYGISHRAVQDLSGLGEILREAMATSGPEVIEIDMAAVGDFARPFAGPPARHDGESGR